MLGFGRIGQLVATRARAFGMRVVAYDPFVSTERFRELGVEKAESPEDVLAAGDFITLHLPKTPETQGFINAETLAQCKDGVRIINVARGPLVVDEDLKAALDSGKVAGAALDVFAQEPITDHPLFGYPNVVVTPHLGASTAEAQDRAGVQTAEQVVAALTGGVVSTAVNIPAVSAEDMEVLGPFIPLAAAARHGSPPRSPTSVERVEVEHMGRIAERDTRLLTLSRAQRPVRRPHRGGGQPRQRARRWPRSAGSRSPSAARRTRATTPTWSGSRSSPATSACASSGTTLGHLHRPHLLEAWGQRFNLQIDDPHLALFRYSDVPGMVGRVGSLLGEHGINISAAAVGRQAPGDGGARPRGDGGHDRRRRPGRRGRGDRRLRRLRAGRAISF